MKEQMVIVITYNRNNKIHYFLCKDMETAKRFYPSAEKRYVTVIG